MQGLNYNDFFFFARAPGSPVEIFILKEDSNRVERFRLPGIENSCCELNRDYMFRELKFVEDWVNPKMIRDKAGNPYLVYFDEQEGRKRASDEW